MKQKLEIQPHTTTAHEIFDSIRRIRITLKEPVITQANLFDDQLKDKLLPLLTCLNDLLQKASDAGLRVDFTDEVEVGPKLRDVTDLVNKARNSLSHISSDENYFKGQKMSEHIGTWNDGDMFYGFGNKRLLEHAHIRRAFSMVEDRLTPLILEPDQIVR